MKWPTVPETVLQISFALAYLVTQATAQCVWTLTSASCREQEIVANMLIVTTLTVALHAIAPWDSQEMDSTVLVSNLYSIKSHKFFSRH